VVRRNYSFPSDPNRPPAFTDSQLQVMVPYWLLVVLFAALPLWWLRANIRAMHRRQENLCPNCGYDLRATPQAGGPLLDRCPECGAIPTKAA
jgi:hypothetical protein